MIETLQLLEDFQGGRPVAGFIISEPEEEQSKSIRRVDLQVFYFFDGESRCTYAIDEYSYRFYIAPSIVKRMSTMSKG
jgi:hypothetical protein